jgi:YVTN family beta-propeller protein
MSFHRTPRGLGLAVVLTGLLGTAHALGASAPTTVGPRPDGTAIAPTGHRITPAGRQSNVGDLPLGAALSPDGRSLLVSNDGQGTQSLQLVDVATGGVRQVLPYTAPASLYVGVAWSPDGKSAYASGGGDQKVHRYDVSGDQLTETTAFALPKTAPDGTKVSMFPAGLAVTPDGSKLVVADQLADAVSTIDVATGAVSTTAVGHAPRTVTLSPDGGTAWVTNEGGDTLSVLDVSGVAPRVTGSIPVGTHPVAAVLSGKRLYVANGESDTISVVDTKRGTVTDTWSLSPYSGAQVGVSPSALTLDGDRLYVTGAGNDDVLALDTGNGHLLGALPTGWYPTGVVVAGKRLLVLNGKGLGAGPNNGPGHPDPTSSAPTSPSQYSGSMIVGTMSTIDLPVTGSALHDGAAQVAANNDFVAARRQAASSKVKHVIYVVQENRTYDQVFGSLGKGNGDPSLNLFGDESAPNQRALQKQYVTLDNFYADAEVSAQGWNWSTAAGSSLFSESVWPSNYSGRGAPYPSESSDPATAPNRDPKDAYIWDRLADKGIPFRNYGFYVNNSATGSTAVDPVLDASTDHAFRGFDMSCPDNSDTFTPMSASCGTPRYDEWKREFDGYVSRGDLPTVEFVRLPNDHTSGTRAGSPTPRAYVADNDLALGRLVDAVTHSPYGKDTAVLVTEDDAQNGPDHVDAHRTISQLISPWTRTGAVDSSLYSTSSMLRTIEDLVGIGPLTQNDAQAGSLVTGFASTPDLTAYSSLRPAEAGNQRNAASAPMAAVSAAQPLGREDQVDPLIFNQAIWQSVKGPRSSMPWPVHGRD